MTAPNALAEEAARWLQDRLPEMEQVLAPLVEQNSFTDNVDGGRKVALMLDTLFDFGGTTREVIRSTRYADHRVYRTAGGGAGPVIGLVGHFDTVFPPGKFEGYRVDGPLRRGPGVLDMKGGLVVIAFALKALAEVGALRKLPSFCTVIVSDEEVGSPEGQGVIQKALAGAQAALVFEAGRAGDAIVTRRKGTGGMTATARGKAAHAGNNYVDGCNAIWSLARFVDQAQRLTDLTRGVTVNVGKISGGQGKNTVPDQAEALLDLRFSTRADAEALLAKLEAAARSAAEGVPGTQVVLSGGIAREPLESTPASQALCRDYGVAARASGLGDKEAPLSGGGSDANTTSGMGIPSIDGLGPRGKGFHTVEEQIEAASLVQKAQALARFLGSRVG